jgi:hypothetical protein
MNQQNNRTEESLGSLGLERRTTIKTLALGSLAALVSGGIATPAAADQCPAGWFTQEGWRWCRKCEGMFYALASAGKGVCPAGGAHDDSASGHYYERVGEDIANVQQGGWRWCSKCAGFFYARASAGKGVCPAGGKHDDGASGHYAAVIGEDVNGPSNQMFQQGGWRWCGKCEGMFYARASAGMGVCPAGGTHTQGGSGHYASLV